MEANYITVGPARALVTRSELSSRTGVLLYPTIFGINLPMRHFAEELARAGMTAAIWDPYRGEDVADDIGEVVERSKRCEDEEAVADLVAIAGHLEGALGMSVLGGIGWCFGGRIGLIHAALDQRVRTLCAYNPTMLSSAPVEIAGIGTISRSDSPGQTMDEFALAKGIRGPVQVTRPAHDFTQSAEYDALFAALMQRDEPTFYEYYPGTDHGFSYRPGAVNERSHHLAWQRTIALLQNLAAVHRD